MDNKLKSFVENYANPAPYLVRNNWQPVADYGFNPITANQVLRNYYGNMLGGLQDRFRPETNPFIWNIVNQMRNANQQAQFNNAMRYGEISPYPIEY